MKRYIESTVISYWERYSEVSPPSYPTGRGTVRWVRPNFLLGEVQWGESAQISYWEKYSVVRPPKYPIITIIIIIKKDWQCKAGRGRLTPYQSEDPSPTLPTSSRKEDKIKIVEDKKGESN